jgi:FKBP-type peptidyl-prolyl cis-trans isomerase
MSTSKIQRIVILLLALFFAGSTVGIVFYYISANKQNTSTTQTTQEVTPLDNSITLENYQPVSSISSLQAIDLVPGTGETVQAGATVTVNYIGALASTGVVFQSSYDSGQPVSFGLDEVIPGWTQGLPGMQVGGTRRLLIPANLAYGVNPPYGSGIPANADLVFDVELISIN